MFNRSDYSLLLHGQHGIANGPQCYVMCALPVLFDFIMATGLAAIWVSKS
jgi:hypothetical protein